MITTEGLEKARALLNSNFGMYGQGCFDLYVNDIAEILDILNKPDYSSLLKEKYNVLEKQRMG